MIKESFLDPKSYTDPEGNLRVAKIIGYFILGILILIFAFSSWVVIDVGHRGIPVFLGQIQKEILAEGLYFKWPILEEIVKINVQTNTAEVENAAASKDLQTVTAVIALNYSLDPGYVNKLYQTVGDNQDIFHEIITPAIKESIKASTAKYTAEELITQREKVKETAIATLQNQLDGRNIRVENVTIVDLNFSESFNRAIEAKVTAEQDALASRNKLEQVKFEAEQRVTQAKAEAEAIKIQAQAIQQQGGENYVQLQWIKSWENGGSQVPDIITSENAGGFIFNLN